MFLFAKMRIFQHFNSPEAPSNIYRGPKDVLAFITAVGFEDEIVLP